MNSFSHHSLWNKLSNRLKFLKEHFDFKELKKIGFYSKDIKEKDYN